MVLQILRKQTTIKQKQMTEVWSKKSTEMPANNNKAPEEGYL